MVLQESLALILNSRTKEDLVITRKKANTEGHRPDLRRNLYLAEILDRVVTRRSVD